MPKTLVLDREIAVTLTDDKSVTVPDNEVWKLTTFGDMKVNDIPINSDVDRPLLNGIFSSGTTIAPHARGTQSLKKMHASGLAFKLQEV